MNHLRRNTRKVAISGMLALIVCVFLLVAGCANDAQKQQQQEYPAPPPATMHGAKTRDSSPPPGSAKPDLQPDLQPDPQMNPTEQRPQTATGTKPLPPPPKAVRGVYLSSYVVASPARMRSIHALLEETDLNAVVVDMNSGIRMTALPKRDSDAHDPAMSTGTKQLRAAIENLKRRNVYLIARIVVFKDEAVALAKPDWAIKRKNGALWRDRKGHAWVDPYKEEAWPYYQAMVQEAAKAGFDEVQFDYVRFPENGAKVDREVTYANKGNLSKSSIISRFVQQATEHAHQLGIRASADVFGLVGSTHDDMGIGQRWTELAPVTDVLSPMIYPSHYAKGIWGIRNPDLAPVTIITKALQDADKQNKALAGTGVQPAEIRPWLQGFTASWIHPHQSYGPKQIREQIHAARKAGFSSYLIWNPACRYPVF